MLDGSKSFGFPEMGYANCWEDSRVLCQALRPAPGKRILSIASGGDNSFSLAAEGATVIAVDRNPSQIACVELKRVALAKLTYAEVLEFFGLRPFENRGEVYQALASGLSEKSRSYWNLHLSDIEHGFVHSGKFERYFHYFRKFVLPLVHRRGDVQGLLQKRSKEERARYYEEVWNTFRWQALMRIFCSRPVMSRLGRDASCFSHVEGSVVDHAIARARHALVDLPTDDNPFLEYIVTGTFSNNNMGKTTAIYIALL